MSCWKWKEGLCMGGDCYRCKDNPDRPEEPGNGWLGVAFIMLGLGTGVLMGFILWTA